jgi:hypothetical protein
VLFGALNAFLIMRIKVSDKDEEIMALKNDHNAR